MYSVSWAPCGERLAAAGLTHLRVLDVRTGAVEFELAAVVSPEEVRRPVWAAFQGVRGGVRGSQGCSSLYRGRFCI